MEELCQDPDNSRVETWLNSQGDQGGAALLHYAAAKGSLEVVKFLVEKDRVVVKEIEIDWEQNLCYERSNELVLLQIQVL